MVPENLKYTKEHEWASVENGRAKLGITDYAQAQLGDIVYVELPKKGSQVKQSAPCGIIESVKAVSEVFAPLSGTVVEVNSALNDAPQDINQDPYGKGWMVVVQIAKPDEVKNLLSAEEYQGLVHA